MEKKCTQCGSTKLVKAKYSFVDSLDHTLPIHIFVCEECGHLELFEDKNNSAYFPKNKKGKEVM